MRVLLTGASGFLGSHLASVLVDGEFYVAGLVRDRQRCPAGCQPIVADLADTAAMKLIRHDCTGFDVLLHVAATMPTTPSRSRGHGMPATHETVTLRIQKRIIIQNLLAACADVRHIIFASSVDVYGIPRTLPVREEHALGPVTDYARVKADDEQILREHCDQSGQTLTILRITHVYGPGEPVIKAIPRFMTTIINGQTPVIFGDGSDLRDFIFVEDVARAFLCAMRNGRPDTYIIATGTSVTIRQVLDLIIGISGKSIGSTFQERQTSKIDLRFDTSKARNGLGFTAQTLLMDGLRAEYDWFVRHSG